MHANINLTVLRVQTQTHTNTETPDKAVGLAQGSMAAGLTGSQPDWQVVRGSAEARASLRVSGFLSLCTSPNEGVGELRQAQRGGLTATEVHVCFGLLLITVLQAAKPLCLRPLHQSNTLVLQRAAGTLDGWCYSLLSGLAALW